MYSNQTPNYDLPQYVGTDYPSWLTDFNESMSKIDTALHANKVKADGNSDSIESLQQSVETLNENFNGIDSKVDELDGAVDQATKTANTAKIAADSATAAITQYDSRIESLETDSSKYASDIGTLQGEVNSLKGASTVGIPIRFGDIPYVLTPGNESVYISPNLQHSNLSLHKQSGEYPIARMFINLDVDIKLGHYNASDNSYEFEMQETTVDGQPALENAYINNYYDSSLTDDKKIKYTRSTHFLIDGDFNNVSSSANFTLKDTSGNRYNISGEQIVHGSINYQPNQNDVASRAGKLSFEIIGASTTDSTYTTCEFRNLDTNDSDTINALNTLTRWINEHKFYLNPKDLTLVAVN